MCLRQRDIFFKKMFVQICNGTALYFLMRPQRTPSFVPNGRREGISFIQNLRIWVKSVFHRRPKVSNQFWKAFSMISQNTRVNCFFFFFVFHFTNLNADIKYIQYKMSASNVFSKFSSETIVSYVFDTYPTADLDIFFLQFETDINQILSSP